MDRKVQPAKGEAKPVMTVEESYHQLKALMREAHAQIDTLVEQTRDHQTSSKRPNSPDLNKMLGEEFKVLDHGFVRVIDYMGDDSAIVQAARVSYGEGTKTVREDAALIDYLLRNGHTSPFEHCRIKLHIKAPIYIARQWMRHRMASINELSGRYSEINEEFHVPDEFCAQSKDNKQARAGRLEKSGEIRDFQRISAENAFMVYEQMLLEGVAREQARIVLPLSTYTEWYWTIDLHNLMNFLKLRLHSHAQAEIQAYANEIAKLVALWTPAAYQSFCDHVLHGKQFSRQEIEVVRRLIDRNVESLDAPATGLSYKKNAELLKKLGL